MITEKTCFAEMLKAELMERYGLREDQVAVELTFRTLDIDLGKQILKDFDGINNREDYFEREEQTCDHVFGHGKPVYFVSVHRKDGSNAPYPFGNDEA
jgi:hypothetical protein